MTALLERLVALVAPHTCLVCSIEDNILCEACANDVFVEPASACVLCGVPTVDWRLCKSCGESSNMQAVWVASEYEGAVIDALRRFKFERAKAFYKPLARALDATIPYFDPDTIIVPLPTASGRVRQRGYDQTLLLAKELARIRNLTMANPLVRVHAARQVGATRKERQQQAKTAYKLQSQSPVKGRPVLLVDDICTTGASLNAAAKLIKAAGAAEVSAAVVAWQRFKG